MNVTELRPATRSEIDRNLTEQCPWCNTLIPRTKFLEIQQRIREQERKKLAEAEEMALKRLEEKHKRELQAVKEAATANTKTEFEKKLATAQSEKDRALEKIKKLEGSREELKHETDLKLKKQQEELNENHKKELDRQRAILAKHSDQELLKAQGEFSREREGYQKKIKEMDRQLQRKTAHEIGDGAEIDLFELLREAFPDDRITRIKRGQPGADILHEVLYKGDPCGRIVIDSKNRQTWQNSYATKLREDQVAAKADHAILSTIVFPAGKKELCIESDIIVVNPARAVYISSLLRSAMIRMHVLGLSGRERAGKMSRLYKFITSEAYGQRFKEAGNLTNDILNLDVEEQRQHQNVWKKRGHLGIRLNNVLREIDTEISAIIESSSETGAA